MKSTAEIEMVECAKSTQKGVSEMRKLFLCLALAGVMLGSACGRGDSAGSAAPLPTGSGAAQLVPGRELVASAKDEAAAQALAEQYGIELLSFSDGVAVYHTEDDPSVTVSILKMERTAADNKYLHRDFHMTMDGGIEYLRVTHGEAAVERYLRDYARVMFKPMGLDGIGKYFEELYAAEEASDALSERLSGGRLEILIAYCPALAYMKKAGHTPSPAYGMTTAVLYDELAKICGLRFELMSYDAVSGAAKFAFVKGENA